jgi:hypothetical protein
MRNLLRQDVVDMIVNNYIETISKDVLDGDFELLWCFIEGVDCKPIGEMDNNGLISEYKELFGEDIGICENEYLCGGCGEVVSRVRYNKDKDIDECKDCS